MQNLNDLAQYLGMDGKSKNVEMFATNEGRVFIYVNMRNPKYLGSIQLKEIEITQIKVN